MEKLREKSDDPLVGCSLPGGHVVIELIDVGGMGRVYRAEQKMLGRTVAVKIIHPHLLGDETVEARFITEARAASQLNHPNSVGVIDFGKFEGRLYMVMEYLRGRDLATVAHEDGPLEIGRIVDILMQALAALEEAHAIGIIHRDLKPENLVLSPLRSGGDFVKVLDFGLAKVLEVARGRGKRITDPGMVCGTPEYMAPEQARGDNVDRRADLYACGVLLFELLGGELPFDGGTPRETVLMHLTKIPPDLRALAPHRDIPDQLLDVVYKALAKDPSERFQSANEFSAALKDSTTVEDTTDRPSPLPLQRCRECDATMPRSQKFCGECGSPLHVGSEVPPPPGESAPPEPQVVQLPLPLSGREDELGWLWERRETLHFALASATLAGPNGVGKTRLLNEFLSQAEERGDRVVSVGPDPWWVERSYYALQHAITGLAGLPEHGGDASDWTGISSDGRAGLEAIFDHESPASRRMARRWADAPPAATEGSSTRALAAEALRWALSRAQGRTDGGSVILAIDDLHAVDGASRNAFKDVISEPPLVEALLIAAHQSRFDPGWENAEALALGGLPAKLGAALLGENGGGSALLTGAEDDGERRVLPMYLGQLVRYTREGGEEPPGRLADLISLRIERLDADARRVLQAVAVLGDASRAAQLVALLPDVDELGRYLTVLRQAGFIVVNGPEAACGHPLTREIVLGSIPRGVRRELHVRARRDFGVDDLRIPLEAHALHAYHAGESFEALMLLEQTAARSRARDDPEGAVRALRRALELARVEMARGELDDPESAMMMFSTKLGDALVLAGKHQDAEGILTEALGMAGPQAKERPRILASLANAAHGIGHPADAYTYLDDALRLAEKTKQTQLVDKLELMRQRWFAGS